MTLSTSCEKTHTYLFSCDWFISLRKISSRFIPVAARVWITFLTKAELYSIVCVCHIPFIHSVAGSSMLMDIRVVCTYRLRWAICSEHPCAKVSLSPCFQFSQAHIQKQNDDSYTSSVHSFDGPPSCFSTVATPLYIPTNTALKDFLNPILPLPPLSDTMLCKDQRGCPINLDLKIFYCQKPDLLVLPSRYKSEKCCAVFQHE